MRIAILALLPAVAALTLVPRAAAAQDEFHWKGKVAPGKAIEIKGVNGDVRAVAGSGDIVTDFPLMVRGRLGPRSLRGTIGSGGRRLALETVNGSIRLRKST